VVVARLATGCEDGCRPICYFCIGFEACLELPNSQSLDPTWKRSCSLSEAVTAFLSNWKPAISKAAGGDADTCAVKDMAHISFSLLINSSGLKIDAVQHKSLTINTSSIFSLRSHVPLSVQISQFHPLPLTIHSTSQWRSSHSIGSPVPLPRSDRWTQCADRQQISQTAQCR
jgi:hypothetical protein